VRLDGRTARAPIASSQVPRNVLLFNSTESVEIVKTNENKTPEKEGKKGKYNSLDLFQSFITI
jgi:hypothetical protein